MTPNPTEILRAAEIFLADGEHELRAPKTADGTISGLFDDPDALAAAAISLHGKAPGIYITLNPVLKPANNRVTTNSHETTKAADIARRSWLLVDFDPIRESNTSATDAEHDLAIEAARNCAEDLLEAGWPQPLWADSGNGSHILFRIDLPNDAESTALVKRVLEALREKYTVAGISVDRTVFDPSRISKLYGTVAAKGPHSEERPHRLSRILAAPETTGPTPSGVPV